MDRYGLAWIRRRQRTFATSVLALFCVVWLQAALAPCAMAFAPGHGAAAPEQHCPYCPPAHDRGDSKAPGTGSATCAYPDQPQSDNRAPNLTAAAMPALPVVLTFAPVATLDDAPAVDQARPPARPPAPLAVTYCRFLK